MAIMKRLLPILILGLMCACVVQPQIEYRPGEGSGQENNPGEEPAVPAPNADAVFYSSLTDQVRDAGQFYIPRNEIGTLPYWNVVHTDYGNREDPAAGSSEGSGLQGYLLMHSVVGLINKAAAEGKIGFCAWMEKGELAYDTERATLGARIGSQTALELATKSYGKWEGIDVQAKDLFKGYVLTDLENNPESGNIAAVASHVHDALIVDVKNEKYFKDNGYSMLCDCRTMTLRQAFESFKDKCDNSALVLMPAGVKGRNDIPAGELRDYAIANRLFVVNIAGGLEDNSALFGEILDWLTPCSQVIGWENNEILGEDRFVNPVSGHGHMMLAADWSYNHTLTSRNYAERQPSTRAKTINPRDIDYDKQANYLSFFLTDGDNYQFIITDAFVNNYYKLQSAVSTKTAFELGSQSLIQLAPTRFRYLLEQQPSADCTIMETFGGGYYYIDTFSTQGQAASNRAANIRTAAERTAAHMRQHGIKILHVMARDFDSPAGQEMLQAFVDANDQLEGITGVEYNPYTGGGGKVYWFKNKAGYDIPLITTKYMLWQGMSSPSFCAQSMRNNEVEGTQTFATVAVHAWSTFDGKRSSDAASLLINQLEDRFQVVSVQELIWRLRMAERKDQTRAFLATIK